MQWCVPVKHGPSFSKKGSGWTLDLAPCCGFAPEHGKLKP